jgi:putative hemolysin
MSEVFIEVVIIAALLVANGVFAMSELAVVSARKARLEQLVNEKHPQATLALRLAEAPGDFLSTVQVGITLIGILAGAFGGATLAAKLAEALAAIPFLSMYSEALAFGLVVIAITYFSLVIGELTPKHLALNNPERVAMAVAGPMQWLSKIASPVVWVLSVSTQFVLRVLRIRPSTEAPVSEEEIKVLLGQGAEAGVFLEAEQDIVESVFRLNDRRVGALMTPRHETIWLDLDDTPEDIQHKVVQSARSRFPVCAGSLDNVVGIVRAKDLLARCWQGKPLDLQAIMRPPLYALETLSGLQLLELLRKSRTHIALVVDEYGGVQGMVTANDILEAIVGDLPTHDQPAEQLIVQRDDGSWLVDGMLLIDDFREFFDSGPLPSEGQGFYQTLGGFVMTRLGHIPNPGEHFVWNRFRFEVMDMDDKRVDKVLVIETPNSTPGKK